MTDDTRWNASVLPAAPLSAPLRARLLQAMRHAQEEGQEEEEFEHMLSGRLAPAPPALPLRLRLAGRMKEASASFRRETRGARFRWKRVGAVAASVLLLAAGGALLFTESRREADVAAYTSRSVIETQGSPTLQWQDGLIPVQSYEVTYEDSFVLPGDDDTTLVIRVPNRTTISVREDII